MSSTWTLHGSGRREHSEWALLHHHTRDWTAAWADTGGFHVEPMPATAPATTHLWAFTTHQWLRVRIDVPYWWAAVLTLDVEFALSRPQEETSPSWTRKEISPPTVVWVRHWEPNDDRIKQYVGPADVLGRHDHVQLLPPLPLCAPFLGHQNSLPAKCRRNIDISPLPDDADEGEEAPPEG